MSTLDSMELAVGLAQRQRDQARQALAMAQQQWQFEQNQYLQLETYAKETEQRWVTQTTGHSTPELMRHYYQFMDKLQHALALQRQVQQDAAQRMIVRQDALVQAEFTLSSRETVVAQLRLDMQRRSQQREQKQVDEIAALQYRRNQDMSERGGQR